MFVSCSNDKECSSCKEKDCSSNWEKSFICPDRLIEAVKDMILQRLSLTKSIVEDNNPNGIEGA